MEDERYVYGRFLDFVVVERFDLFMAGATERAIARTTATSGAAKPSSGETTRPLNKIKKYCTITVTITQ